MPHQLEPALAVLAGHGSRVLLADAVGLGKTVQAGLLLAELRRRGAVQSALVLTPAGLRDQWRRELSLRFGIAADIIDLRSAATRAADLPVGVPPWTVVPVVIASLDYVKRAEVLPAVRSRAWDLVIVDEAHLVSPGSDRHTAVAQLCELAACVILLTATPHNGDREAYQALHDLGAREDECLFFRRTRNDVRIATARHVHHLQVRLSSDELRMHAALDRYTAAVHAEQGDAAHAHLLLSILRKRALSSPSSLVRSIERRLSLLGLATPTDDDRQLRLPLDDGGGEWDVGDEAPRLDMPALRDLRRERQLLQRVAQLADVAVAHESKLAALGRLLRRLEARGEPAIVFTEYRDTLVHVQQAVAPQALVLHGGLSRGERQAVVSAFTDGHALVLLATDAAGEGLNLQARCRCVIHLEVPWNPVRLEQRTGRVDRIGQSRTVHAFHLVSQHPSEEQRLQRMNGRAAVAAADTEMATLPDSWRAARALAAEEAVRIARSRACLSGRRSPRASRGSLPVPTRYGVAMVARSPLRRRLAAQVRSSRQSVLLIERQLVDEGGLSIASTLEGWWLSNLPGRRRRPPSSPYPPHAHILLWTDEQLAVRDRFWTTTRARAVRIAAATGRMRVELFQPGLFDRRLDRLRQVRHEEQEALAAATQLRARRYDALHSATTLTSGRWLLIEP